MAVNKIEWKSPSNIALIKYWGKFGDQLPANASLSFSLKNSVTTTSVEYKPGYGKIDYLFESQLNEAFSKRILNYIEKISWQVPSIRKYDLKIESSNSFPHSAGIASSASAFSALALCILDLEYASIGKEKNENFYQQASTLARLGSGSACRSVYGGYNLWGMHKQIGISSNAWAIPVNHKVHNNFKAIADTILIVDEKKKSTSSSAGHALMEDHFYAQGRKEQAGSNLNRLFRALKTGDLNTWIDVVESEALSLHALMMSSKTPYLLLKPNSISIIQKIQEFRNDSGLPVCFSIDAGPNIHLIYPLTFKDKVKYFIETELKKYCHKGQYIEDEKGEGPEKLL